MIRAIIAFLASAFTALQTFFLYRGGKGICFNSGCEVVDSLTTVSPLYLNIAGVLFFQAIFWCLLWGRKGSEYWHKLARLLLLTGLATEAVLSFFQYSIAAVFCSYCLVVFSIIVLLNILCGLRQIFCGAVLFFAVIVTCFSLQFRTATGSGASLDAGSIAIVAGEQQDAELYLFFSSTCSHCEKIINSLRQENHCTVRFNPVERIDMFTFPGAAIHQEYNPSVNFNFLKSLSLKEVPVLVAREQHRTLVIKGEQMIREYLEENCRNEKVEDYSGTTSATAPSGYDFQPTSGNPTDDGCILATDCDNEESGKVREKE
jgi:hypothetical protein